MNLDAIYAAVPDLVCGRACGSVCTTGPIPIGVIEWEGIRDWLGVSPPHGDQSTWVCPFYADGACTIHPVRPLICRLWGAVEDMRCPHGCTPERFLTRGEAEDLLRAVYALGGKSYWVWGKHVYDKEMQVKQIELKQVPTVSLDGKVGTLDYKESLILLARQPLSGERGMEIEEMRKSIRLLDALEAAEGSVSLEDADYEYLKQKVHAGRFARANRETFQFLRDVLGEEQKDEKT